MFQMPGAREVIGRIADSRIHTFAEDTSDPATFLQQADIWVYSHSPHWRETACIAMLEAMACGLPVIVNNAGGMREYLIHERCGFACTDLDEYVQFVRLLLDQPTLRAAMAEEACRYARQQYSLDALTSRVRMLLEI